MRHRHSLPIISFCISYTISNINNYANSISQDYTRSDTTYIYNVH